MPVIKISDDYLKLVRAAAMYASTTSTLFEQWCEKHKIPLPERVRMTLGDQLESLINCVLPPPEHEIMTKENNEYVIVLVGDGHRYWAGSGWSNDPEKAIAYITYGNAARVMWRELPPPENGRYVAVPKSIIMDLRTV